MKKDALTKMLDFNEKQYASLSFIILSCVAGTGIGCILKPTRCGYAHVGMHINLFLYGLLGFLKTQLDSKEVLAAFAVNIKATRCLALPFLLAEYMMYKNRVISVLHALSGVIPFVVSIAGYEHREQVVDYSLIANLIVLSFYSMSRGGHWGWMTMAAALAAYFVVSSDDQVKYPLALALFEYCSYRFHCGC